MEKITIQTASKQYPLYLGMGIRHQLLDLLASLEKEFSSYLIISDEKVASLYLDEVVKSLKGERTFTYIVPTGETAKSFAFFLEGHTKALESGLDRRSCIIALGGGVIGDLAGFIAATYMRGIGFIQVPTTLLAHDSSVGGKVAINHPLGKNMIGAFYQPDAVVYDIETLKSLSDREWLSGFAEVIKHGLIRDQSLYVDLTNQIKSLHDLKQSNLIDILRRAIAVKTEIVQRDETETGIRSHLNFGHTLAHAIEAELGYGEISHGEAVVIGMVFALKISEKYYNQPLFIDEFVQWVQSLGFSTSIPASLTPEQIMSAMKKDKKAYNAQIHMVLLKEIGHVENVPVEDQILYATIKKELEREE